MALYQRRWTEATQMLDVLAVLTVALFVGACLLYVRAADRL
jgi:hypothetical protein